MGAQTHLGGPEGSTEGTEESRGRLDRSNALSTSDIVYQVSEQRTKSVREESGRDAGLQNVLG